MARRNPAVLLGCVLRDAIISSNARRIDRVCFAAARADQLGRARGAVARCISVAESHADHAPWSDAATRALSTLGE